MLLTQLTPPWVPQGQEEVAMGELNVAGDAKLSALPNSTG